MIDIVIPVYNEGGNIVSTLAEIKNKIQTEHKTIIVYDYDNDDTLPVVHGLISNNYPLTLIKNAYGRGVLNAIKTGFAAAKDAAVLVVMADLSDDLAKVDAMYEKMTEGYDIVCGSRYMEGGKQIGGPWLKGTFSRMAGISLYYLAGLPTHDVTNSFKLYKKEVLNSIEIESDGGFELGMEIVIKAFFSGYKISEIPSTWKDRSAGKSKFKLWQWIPKYFHWYLFAIKGRLANIFNPKRSR